MATDITISGRLLGWVLMWISTSTGLPAPSQKVLFTTQPPGGCALQPKPDD